MTLRAVQTAKVCKFGPKNGISSAQKNVLLKMIYLYFIFEISFSFTKFHFRLRNSILDYRIFFAILGYEICILGYQIWIWITKCRFCKVEVKGIKRI